MSSTHKTMQWIDEIVDENSFHFYNPNHNHQTDISSSSGSEVLIGLASIQGKPVALYAHDSKINRGYISSQGAIKICCIMDKAQELQIPIVALLSSPGIDLEEGLLSGSEYTKVITKNIALSGIIPQLAVIMGPTLGAPAYSSVLMDFIFFNKYRSFIMVTSPTVVQVAINEKTSMSELGGYTTHAYITGIADFFADHVSSQITQVKNIISFLPAHSNAHPHPKEAHAPLDPLPTIPVNPRLPFNMLTLIKALIDGSDFIEYKPFFGRSMLCGFAYLHGYPVAIIANQSIYSSGAIDCDASQKTARFLKICDAYNIPILTLIDVPGFMPGKREEQRGLLKYGAKLCAAMQTQTPRLSVVVRKCYGAAAFLLMQSRSQGGSLSLALETANIGVMGGKTADRVRQLDLASQQVMDKNNFDESAPPASTACSLGLIDDIVPLTQLRQRLFEHLKWLFDNVKSQPRIQKSAINPWG